MSSNLKNDSKIPNKIKTFVQINFIKLSFYVFLIFTVVLGLYSIIPLFQTLVIAFILSYIINPVVTYFERLRVPRVVVIFFLFVITMAFFVVALFFIKAYFPTSDDINQIEIRATENLNGLQEDLQSRIDFIDWKDFFNIMKKNIGTDQSITEKLPEILSSFANIFSIVIVVPFCLFFFLLSGRDVKKKMLTLVPNRYFEMTVTTLRQVDRIFGGYIRGTILESFVVGVMATFGFYFVGFPIVTSFITGMIVGVTNAIPYIGPVFGAVVGIAIVILRLIPVSYVPVFGIEASIAGVIIVVMVVQFIDNFLKPAIIGKSVNLHPLIVILGVIAGNELFGFVGMLAAIPVIAIIKVLITSVYSQLIGFGFLSDNLVSVISKDISNS